MKHHIVYSFTVLSLILSAAAAAAGASPSVAATQHLSGSVQTTLGPARTGQPNQMCGSAAAPITPGNAASAPGSAFNHNGQAGTVYAGQQLQNSINTASVAQYDVACSHQR